MANFVDDYIKEHGHPPNFLPDPVVTREEFQDLLREEEKLRNQRKNAPGQPPPKEIPELDPSNPLLKGLWKGAPQPHWAVALFLDPRTEFGNGLQPGEDYPRSVDLDRALGMFDEESPGWVPLWFPDQRDGQKFDRLDWFDKALAYYAQTEWPPEGSLSSRQRAVALSLLHMLYEEDLQGIPTPDRL
jgi:hypothetical protein